MLITINNKRAFDSITIFKHPFDPSRPRRIVEINLASVGSTLFNFDTMKQFKSSHPNSIISNIQSANQCLSWWLIHCCLYYNYSSPIISDKDFDTLTSWLKMSFDQIDHIHKYLVTKDDLNANTGYAISFPLMVDCSARRILREIEQNTSPVTVKKVAKPQTINKTLSEYDTLFG